MQLRAKLRSSFDFGLRPPLWMLAGFFFGEDLLEDCEADPGGQDLPE